MEQYVIKGGVHLEGEVVIAGAKNAALGILAAAIMTEDECTIENVPYVSDTITLLKAIENIGASVKYIDKVVRALEVMRTCQLMMSTSERSELLIIFSEHF